MKIYSSKQIKLLDIDVQFIDIKSNISSAVIPKDIEDIKDISKEDYEEFRLFLGRIKYLLEQLERNHKIKLISPSFKSYTIDNIISKKSKLSAYWKFYFVVNNTIITDEEYFIDLGVSHHVRPARDANQDFGKYNKDLVDNQEQKCKFERIVINDEYFDSYEDAYIHVKNKLIHLYNTYRLKYANDDFIQNQFPSVYWEDLYKYLELIIPINLSEEEEDIFIELKSDKKYHTKYEIILGDILDKLLELARNCDETELKRYHNFDKIQYLQGYIRSIIKKQPGIIKPMLDLITEYDESKSN